LETDIAPVYARSFFTLQLALAQKVMDLSQQPLDQVILRFTAMYRILGLDWSLNPANPIWQAYMQGLQQAADREDFTYQFYLRRYPDIPKFTDDEHWGCFAYQYEAEKRAIHLHFSNEDRSTYSPLSHHRIEVRKTELRTMFQEIYQRHPDAVQVQGGSWLYNWEAYRRLFPQTFGESARIQARPALYGRALWNQFLRRGWSVHQETMAAFLERVNQLERVDDYPRCFPYPVLLTVAPIHLFYEFYGII
jgi:hypothetical protein